MLKQLHDWYKRRFSDPHLSVLFLVLISACVVVYFLGSILAPLFVALILAYMLEWPVNFLMRFKLNRTFSTFIIMSLFISLSFFAFLGILPTVFTQGAALIGDLPAMFNHAQAYLATLPSQYPDLIDPNTTILLVNNLRGYILESGGAIVAQSFTSILNVAAFIVYAVLVPMMMVFFLKDKDALTKSAQYFLPANTRLVDQVWVEMNGQIMNYIRGKIIEILIVGIATYLVFFFMDLRYSALLAVLVGLSVLIPYIGAAVVTVPVAVVAVFQWGISPEFVYLMVAYGVVQVIDGNLIVPILFSEAVNLHPVIIIISVLVFGGVWGFWGVFFAIPLATLVKAVINAWPSAHELSQANIGEDCLHEEASEPGSHTETVHCSTHK